MRRNYNMLRLRPRRRSMVILALVFLGVTLLILSDSNTDTSRLRLLQSAKFAVTATRNSAPLPTRQDLTLDIAARFERRRKRLTEACRGRNSSRGYIGMRHAANRFLFPTNTTPIVLYCAIPKTGSTFLKKTFGEANNQSRVTWADRFNVRPVKDYDKAIMFFFTREPYARILSAYVDKLWSPNLHFWRVLGKQLVKDFRPNATNVSRVCGHDVTFPEFIRYFIDGQTRSIRINSHIVPTHNFCEVSYVD